MFLLLVGLNRYVTSKFPSQANSSLLKVLVSRIPICGEAYSRRAILAFLLQTYSAGQLRHTLSIQESK